MGHEQKSAETFDSYFIHVGIEVIKHNGLILDMHMELLSRGGSRYLSDRCILGGLGASPPGNFWVTTPFRLLENIGNALFTIFFWREDLALKVTSGTRI